MLLLFQIIFSSHHISCQGHHPSLLNLSLTLLPNLSAITPHNVDSLKVIFSTGSIMSRTHFIISLVLLGVLSMLVVFHFLILLRVIPFDYVWGGKLPGISHMLLLETISVVITLIMMTVVAIRGGLIQSKLHPLIIRFALWAMVGFFLLNAIGNFNSENRIEKNVFTPITLVLSMLCLALVLQKK